MAVVYDPNKEKQDELVGQEGQTQANVLSQASTAAGSGGGGQPQAGGSGSFTNLQKYISANEGRGFGQQVAGKIEDTANQAQQAQSQASDAFQQDVNKNKVGYNPDLVQRATSNAADFIKNEQDVKDFQRLRDASYAGPKTLQDKQEEYLKAESATTKAAQQGQSAQSETGRKALLQEFYQRPTYLRGEQNLDNLILQNSKEGRQALSKAGETAQAKQTEFQNLQNMLSGIGTQAQADTTAARQNTRKALGIDEAGNWLGLDKEAGNAGVLQDLVEGVDKRVSGAQEAAGKYDDLYAGLQTGQLSDSDKSLLGLEGQQYWNLRPENYLTKGADPTRSSHITDAEKSQLLALSKLAGRDQEFIDPSVTYAGDSKPYTFDTDAFKGAAQGAEAEYKDAMGNLLFYNDLGGGHVKGILDSSASDADKLDQILKYSSGTNRPATHDDFGWNMPSRNLQDIMREQGELEAKYGSNPYDQQTLANSNFYFKRDQAKQIEDLLKRVKGYNKKF